MYQELLEKVNKLIVIAKSQNMNVGLECGTRSFAEQDRLYAKGRDAEGHVIGKVVTNAKAGLSWHNYGLAADVVAISNGNWSWALPEAFWRKLGYIGTSLGLEYGGDWSGSLCDLDHFQITKGVTIYEAYDAYRRNQSVPDVWALVASRGS